MLDAAKEEDDVRVVARKHHPLLHELAYCYIVDRFLIFISCVVTRVFSCKPETLRSNEKVDIAFVLQHQSMDDLLASLVERKVLDLSFKGLSGVAQYFEDRLGVPLAETEDQLRTAILATEIRNLIVHNRGTVNRLFQSRVPFFPCAIGQRINPSEFFHEHAGLFLTLTNRTAGQTNRYEVRCGGLISASIFFCEGGEKETGEKGTDAFSEAFRVADSGEKRPSPFRCPFRSLFARLATSVLGESIRIGHTKDTLCSVIAQGDRFTVPNHRTPCS